MNRIPTIDPCLEDIKRKALIEYLESTKIYEAVTQTAKTAAEYGIKLIAVEVKEIPDEYSGNLSIKTIAGDVDIYKDWGNEKLVNIYHDMFQHGYLQYGDGEKQCKYCKHWHYDKGEWCCKIHPTWNLMKMNCCNGFEHEKS